MAHFVSNFVAMVTRGHTGLKMAILKNHTLEPNMKCIGWPVAEISPFEIRPNEWLVTSRSVSQSVVQVSSPETVYSWRATSGT